MSLPILMRAAAPRVQTLLKAPKAVIEGVAKRIGQPGATAKEIVDLAKNNKLVTFTILYELYGAADELVTKFLSNDASLAGVVGLFDRRPDEPDMDAEAKNDLLADEFELISQAVTQVGGFDRLMVLRRALALSGNTYVLYKKRATQGRLLSL